MFPRRTPPPLPDIEPNMLPQGEYQIQKVLRECNWFQGLEGDIDTSHLYFLHGRLNADDPAQYGVFHKDKAPRLEIVETEYGVLYGARREERPGQIYWRTTQYVFPIYGMFPGGGDDGTVPLSIYLPVDDYNTLHWGLRWHPSKPFEGDGRPGVVAGPHRLELRAGHGRWRRREHGRQSVLHHHGAGWCQSRQQPQLHDLRQAHGRGGNDRRDRTDDRTDNQCF